MSDEGIYRKVFVRMWGDARVMRLSPMPPSGQSLWTHLLCGEQTGIIPGVFRIGERAFAEQLKWSLESFREAFRECFAQGLVKADWQARLVWVPNAIKWNIPANPNMISHWATAWELLPECELKDEICQAFKSFFEPFKEGFRKALDEAFKQSGSRKQGSEIRNQEAKKPSERERGNADSDPRAPQFDPYAEQHAKAESEREKTALPLKKIWLAAHPGVTDLKETDWDLLKKAPGLVADASSALKRYLADPGAPPKFFYKEQKWPVRLFIADIEKFAGNASSSPKKKNYMERTPDEQRAHEACLEAEARRAEQAMLGGAS